MRYPSSSLPIPPEPLTHRLQYSLALIEFIHKKYSPTINSANITVYRMGSISIFQMTI